MKGISAGNAHVGVVLPSAAREGLTVLWMLGAPNEKRGSISLPRSAAPYSALTAAETATAPS